MTEQPKFQRRKRRGTVSAVEQPKRPVSKPAVPTITELQAQIAEKEALLQRTAELEAEREHAAEQASLSSTVNRVSD